MVGEVKKIPLQKNAPKGGFLSLLVVTTENRKKCPPFWK